MEEEAESGSHRQHDNYAITLSSLKIGSRPSTRNYATCASGQVRLYNRSEDDLAALQRERSARRQTAIQSPRFASTCHRFLQWNRKASRIYFLTDNGPLEQSGCYPYHLY
jgi:hypothetical protein